MPTTRVSWVSDEQVAAAPPLPGRPLWRAERPGAGQAWLGVRGEPTARPRPGRPSTVACWQRRHRLAHRFLLRTSDTALSVRMQGRPCDLYRCGYLVEGIARDQCRRHDYGRVQRRCHWVDARGRRHRQGHRVDPPLIGKQQRSPTHTGSTGNRRHGSIPPDRSRHPAQRETSRTWFGSSRLPVLPRWAVVGRAVAPNEGAR